MTEDSQTLWGRCRNWWALLRPTELWRNLPNTRSDDPHILNSASSFVHLLKVKSCFSRSVGQLRPTCSVWGLNWQPTTNGLIILPKVQNTNSQLKYKGCYDKDCSCCCVFVKVKLWMTSRRAGLCWRGRNMNESEPYRKRCYAWKAWSNLHRSLPGR